MPSTACSRLQRHVGYICVCRGLRNACDMQNVSQHEEMACGPSSLLRTRDIRLGRVRASVVASAATTDGLLSLVMEAPRIFAAESSSATSKAQLDSLSAEPFRVNEYFS